MHAKALAHPESLPLPAVTGWRGWLERHGQTALDLYLFLSFGIWCVWSTHQTWREGRLTLLELSFVIPNFLLAGLFLLRKRHQAVCTRPFDQAVALVAFFSGLPIMGSQATGGEGAALVSGGVIFLANLLGIACLLGLGRSFGILIAFRELRDSGLYGVIRHPMYLSDILLRVGYVISHADAFSVTVVCGGTLAYVYRAILEERFLVQQADYAAYMQRVPWRFIPGLF